MTDSKAAIDALFIMRRLWEDFQGLRDSDVDVNCSDLVGELSYQLGECDALRRYLIKETGLDNAA